MYAYSGSAYATAVRNFDSPLSVGQTFSLQLGVNFRNGNKGVDINDSSLTGLFNFNVGANDYQVNASTLGLIYAADSIFTLSFEQKSGTMIGVTITRQTAAFGTETAFNSDLDFGAVMDNFKLYVSGTDDVSSQNNLYFNNLQVVPEPSTYAMLLGALALGIAVTRRKHH